MEEKNIVYIYGDSHCVIFVGIESDNFKTIVAGYDGASITGLNETTSRLEYGAHIYNIMIHRPETYYHLLKMGQVDLEFIMYYKIYVKKEIFTFKEFCDTVIEKYRIFLDKLLKINKNIIICSINLPAYEDDINIKEYIRTIISVNASSDDVSNMMPIMMYNDTLDPILCDFSLEQLVKNFTYFNDLLQNLAREYNLLYYDSTDVFIDDISNNLRDIYRSSNHHYKGYSDPNSEAKKTMDAFFKSFFEKI